MFMKNIKHRLFLAIPLSLICSFSCSDLAEDDRGILLKETFLETELDLDAAVTNTYSKFLDNPWGGIAGRDIFAPLMGSDDIMTKANVSGWTVFDRFSVDPLNGTLQNLWAQFYSTIYAANYVIENYHRVVSDNETKINQRVGEVRFLRAFSYFWLVRIHGELPMPTTELDLAIKRSSIETVYEQIVSDLQFAESHLPDSWGGEYGRPSKWSAKSLLSLVYLTMAGWPVKDASKYALAAAKAEEVMDQGPYILLPDFGDLWLMENDYNAEVVWGLVFCPLNTCGTEARTSITARTTGPSEEDGWDQIYCELGFFNKFPEGPRKDATYHTVFTDGTTWQESSVKHPFIAKYRDGSVEGEANYESKDLTGRNMNFIRYAEVMLIYAEATAMASGPDAKAYDAVNQIKRRGQGLPLDVPAPGVDLTPGLSALAFRDEVIEERGWEFVAEFSRWFDLVRTEKVGEMNNNKPSDDLAPLGTITEEDYLLPIPSKERQLNPNLSQNPGYD